MSLRLAAARLVATPLFTLFSVVSLATGVAVTTAVYSVVDTLLLSDLGVAEPDRAAFIVTPYGGRAHLGTISHLDFSDLRRAQTSFSSVSAAAAILPSVAATGNAEIVLAEAVDGAYFSTLGIGATVGRVIQPGDDAAAERVVVLSDEFWRSRLAADRHVVGRSIRINGQAFEVIGVAPRHYRGLFGAMRSTRLWLPLGAEASLGTARSAAAPREQRRLLVFGRLTPGRDMPAASAELATIAGQLDREFPAPMAARGGPSERNWLAKSVAAFSEDDNSLRRFGMMLVALTGLVLLVACTNLANLVLARGTARQGELAVRMAMGASRGRLVWEQCVENLILAGVGALASYVMFQGVSAFMTTDFVLAVPFGGTATLSIRPAVNGEAVTVAVAAMLLALGVFGLEPAVQLARSIDIRSALAAGATGIRPRVGRQRMVIRWQVAIAAGFFIVATMFIRATINQARHDPGIDMDRLAVAVMSFDNGVWNEDRMRRTLDRVIDESRNHPTLESLTVSTGLPFGVPAPQANVSVPGVANAQTHSVSAIAATPSIFRTLGVELAHGRGFNDTDAPAAPPVVILSELTARQVFGSTDALGRTLVVKRQAAGETLATVIGIARDTDVRRIYSDRRPLIYLPLSQHFESGVTITARSSGNTGRAVAALREAIRQADSDLTVSAIGAGPMLLAGPFVLVRSMGMGALYLGGITLLLSMAGLFGVQSHVVAHRTREIGVRMSIGASARQIKLMVLKDGYRPVFEGLVLGLWGGIAGRIILRAYVELDEVTIIDPWMLLLTPIPLIAAAFWACYLPAAKAASVEPTIALRYE